MQARSLRSKFCIARFNSRRQASRLCSMPAWLQSECDCSCCARAGESSRGGTEPAAAFAQPLGRCCWVAGALCWLVTGTLLCADPVCWVPDSPWHAPCESAAACWTPCGCVSPVTASAPYRLSRCLAAASCAHAEGLQPCLAALITQAPCSRQNTPVSSSASQITAPPQPNFTQP